MRGDATKLGDNREAVRAVVEHFGGLTCFVANTGVWDFGVSVEDLPDDFRFDDAFTQMFDLNVKAMLAGAKAAAGALRASHGSLVMTASSASLHPGGGGPLYTAAKHAVVGLVKQLAYELALDVRVNAVAPGGMKTALSPPSALAHVATSIADLPMDTLIPLVSPLGSLPQPSDYAGWYVALASADDALTMTGSVIECDAGEAVRGRAWSDHARAIASDTRAHADRPGRSSGSRDE
jgi:NAD(P)-dependent dehydrogenase (short-subunit alcohol dehydrogenase family)